MGPFESAELHEFVVIRIRDSIDFGVNRKTTGCKPSSDFPEQHVEVEVSIGVDCWWIS